MLDENNGEKREDEQPDGPVDEAVSEAGIAEIPQEEERPYVSPLPTPRVRKLDFAAILFLCVNLLLLLVLATVLISSRKKITRSFQTAKRQAAVASVEGRPRRARPNFYEETALPPLSDIYEIAEEAPEPTAKPQSKDDTQTPGVSIPEPDEPTVSSLLGEPTPEAAPEAHYTMDGPRAPEVGVNFKDRDRLYVVAGSKQPVEKYKSYTPDLIDAVISCDVKAVGGLLQDGSNVNIVDDAGDSALAWAIKRRCTPVAKLLIGKGANVNALSRNGFTPYIWARLYKTADIQALLLKAGADPKSGNYWWRFEQDGQLEWVSRALENACRNKDCLSENTKKSK